MSEPVKIAIILEGGMVQDVLSAGVPVQYVMIDYDADNADPDDIVMVPQGENQDDERATGYISDAEIDGPRVDALFSAVEAKGQPSPLHAAAALVRDGLDLMSVVEGVEDIEIEAGYLKVIANGQCFRVSIEMIG